ncbi:putative inner membrane protein [Escherichia coli]|uniref:Putative inner membrane protein n=1 Tax=Escherichia coli TaxID=562 RepID=A0A376L417_ECOLX|nr:putative inner membrane protein [Escherichia coli]
MDKLTWLMEVTPVIIVVPLLLATAKRYPLTPLLYTLIFFHAIILNGRRTIHLRESPRWF